jgi:diguanylate cyclase
MFSSRIVVKLTLWIALLSILSASASVYYSYNTSRELLTQSAKERLSTATGVLANRYNFFIADIAKDLVFLSKLPAIEEIFSADNTQDINQARARLGGALSKFLLAHIEYTQVRLINAKNHGREIVRVDKSLYHTLIVEGLALQEKAHFSYVFNTLKLKPGEIYISSIKLNKERGILDDFGKPTIIVATPVYTHENKLLGIIVLNVDLEQMFSLIQTDVDDDIKVIATNAEGDYLIHPDKKKIFGFDKGKRHLLQNDILTAQKIYSGEENKLVSEIADLQSPNKQAVIALEKVTLNALGDQKYIVLGLMTSLDEVHAQSNQLGLNTLKISLLFCALLILIAYFLALRISTPINTMATTFARFKDGDEVPVLAAQSNDELGLLARNFSTMAKKLNNQFVELRNQRRVLHQVAHHDPLTGLPNRLLVEDRISQALIKAKREKSELAIMLIDLDNFKPVNDVYGHDIGDKLLKATAKAMLACVREVDTVARIGGDEFIIVLSSGDLHHHSLSSRHIGRQIAEKIRASLSQSFKIENFKLTISCSIGIALYPSDGTTLEVLTKQADQAMYYAKSMGKNTIKLYSDITVD